MSIFIANDRIANSSYEKILGINFDNKLNFNTHVTKLCRKAGQKLHALARISNFMSLKKKKLLMNTFITSQFNYCPLVWMCHSIALNTHIFISILIYLYNLYILILFLMFCRF